MDNFKASSPYICSFHEITEDDLDFEKKNIIKYTEENKEYSCTLKNLFYPIFRYDRSKVYNNGNGKLPYGECFTSAFNKEGALLGCGYSNGYINVFNLKDKNEPIMFKVSDYPISSLKWNGKQNTMLLIGSVDGRVFHWKINSGKASHILKEENNSINSLDYSFDYNNFITAGKDVTVRLYDENTKNLITSMKAFKFDQPGHSGRIFCVKFFPRDTSTIYSGGWDKTIQFYDTRMGKIANSIYGPEICGESIDVDGNILASGAWSTKEQIQLWDIRTLKCICNVEWENNSLYMPTYIYSVKFNIRNDKKLLCIGGVNQPLFRIYNMDTFNYEAGIKDGNKPTPLFGSGESYSSCYTTDFVKISNNKEFLCAGCSDGGSRIYSLETQNIE